LGLREENRQQQKRKQIPFGDDNQKDNGHCEGAGITFLLAGLRVLEIVFGGLEGGDGGGFGDPGWFFFGQHHALDEFGDGAFAFCDLGDLGARGEDAEGGVDGDVFYGLGFG
jgi:hypothetical protein